jgi:hypothetical protein
MKINERKDREDHPRGRYHGTPAGWGLGTSSQVIAPDEHGVGAYRRDPDSAGVRDDDPVPVSAVIMLALNAPRPHHLVFNAPRFRPSQDATSPDQITDPV